MSGDAGTRNLVARVAYDGTRYHGFQVQSGQDLPTVQAALEEAWEKLVGDRVRIAGAGRTDAGVHALGQVVSFKTESRAIPLERVPAAFNSELPPDVRVWECREAPPEFHARFDAESKVYRYRIANGRFHSPLERLYTHYVPVPLDVAAMARGAAHLVGRHDFTSFSGQNGAAGSAVRTVYGCDVCRSGDEVVVRVEAEGFLYHMVRIIAGTLIEVGKRRRPHEWVEEALRAERRGKAGPTAPPAGLVLESVVYGEMP